MKPIFSRSRGAHKVGRRGFPAVLRGVMVVVGILALGLLALRVRTFNQPQVLDGDGVYYVDGDCYARMERVAEVMRRPGVIVKKHSFENWPVGTRPHTTAPMDYITAGLAVFHGGSKNLAGAWVGPTLAAVALVLLAGWGALRGIGWPWWIGALWWAVAPSLVWANVLGRPDHQALLVPLLTGAMLAEVLAWRGERLSRARNIGPLERLNREEQVVRAGCVAGICWGLALWTSLFEPAILLLLWVVAGVVVNRPAVVGARRARGWIFCGVVLLIALLLEGWRLSPPGSHPLFARWASQLAELQPTDLRGFALSGGLATVGVVAVLVIGAQLRNGWRRVVREALAISAVALVVVGLAMWQGRWMAYASLVVAFAIPAAISAVQGWTRVVALLVAAGLLAWPASKEWEGLLFPSPEQTPALAEQRMERRLLRSISAEISRDTNAGSGEPAGGIVAPYWLTPAVAYWSGSPGVGGTSHQSLDGIADTLRFYQADDARTALQILAARKVRWVIAYDPDRLAQVARPLLGEEAGGGAMARALWQGKVRPEWGLRPVAADVFFRLYEWSPSPDPSSNDGL